MANKGWQHDRPPDWDKIKHDICGCEFEPNCDNCPHGETVEKIASAMRKAMIRWLFETCWEHSVGDFGHDSKCEYITFVDSQIDNYEHWNYAHRKDCPQCMEQLKGD